jgi:hypothetical protein
MPTNKPPRRPYRPRAIVANPVAHAIQGAALPTASQVRSITDQLRQASVAMREGRATNHQWSLLAGSLDTAITIQAGGIYKVFADVWEPAQTALKNIHARAVAKGNGAWASPTLYAQEIQALDVFVFLHEQQLTNLTRGEIGQAVCKTARRLDSQGQNVTLQVAA